MGICDVVLVTCIVGSLIIFYRGFCHTVRDLLLVLILRKVSEAVAPDITGCICPGCLFLYRLFFSVSDSPVELQLHFLRSQTVLVAVVIPGLGSADLHGSRLMGICNVVLVGCIIGSLIVFYRSLLHTVCDLLLILILRKVFEAVVPGVTVGICPGCFHSLYQFFISSADFPVKLQFHFLRSQTVLVAVVIPGLGSADFYCSFFFLISNRNCLFFLTF